MQNPQRLMVCLIAQWLMALGCLHLNHAMAQNTTPTATPPRNYTLTVTAVGAESKLDTRFLFEYDILRLALDKTKNEFGPYILNTAPHMTQTRAITAIENNTYTNLVRTFGYDSILERNHNMVMIRYPLFKGILGLRTCFLANKIVDRFRAAETKEALQGFSHGQGKGWADAAVLTFNGYQVVEIPGYSSLFKMVALNRFDLFCRGANEVMDEYHRFSSSVEDFAYDRSKMFYYPFPHFLYTNKNNVEVLDRMSRGLQIAFKDGSFEQLWQRYHLESIKFVGLESRKLIILKNPLMKDLDLDFRQFLYQPLRELVEAREKQLQQQISP